MYRGQGSGSPRGSGTPRGSGSLGVQVPSAVRVPRGPGPLGSAPECSTCAVLPRAQGRGPEVPRGPDDGLHPDLVSGPAHGAEDQEELCAANAARGGEEVEVHGGRAHQDPGAAGGDAAPQ